MTNLTQQTPLVYSCSGCSNVAQLANDIALWLRDAGIAEMACIAGVGGNVDAHVRKAKSERPILALDGCAMNCVKACLKKHQVEPTWHIQMTDLGFKKTDKESCTLHDMYKTLEYTHEVLGISGAYTKDMRMKLPKSL